MLANAQRPQRDTFSDVERSFEISYPKSFRFVEPGHLDEVQRLSFIPVCQEASVVCITYPRGKYPGTTFEGAGFEISLVSAKSQSMCLTPPSHPDTSAPGYSYRVAFVVSQTHASKVINGVTFEHGEAAGVATGHVVSTDLYRTFHNGKCYELSVNIAQSNFERSPERPREFNAEDSKRVDKDMNSILDSFRFLK